MPALLILAFLVVPIVELYLILQVADVIGGWQTIAVLILESLLGGWLVRREGRRTWRSFQAALEAHRPPGREVADGALVLVGGTLLLTPGFLSDVLGFFVLLPITRPIARRLLLHVAARRVGTSFLGAAAAGGGRARPPRRGAGRPPGPGGARGDAGDNQVIDGEVLGERSADPLRKRPPNDGTPPTP